MRRRGSEGSIALARITFQVPPSRKIRKPGPAHKPTVGRVRARRPLVAAAPPQGETLHPNKQELAKQRDTIMNALAPINTNGAENTYHERLAQFTADYGGGVMLPGLRLQYKQAVWSIEDVAVPPDQMNHVYTALLPSITSSWECWKNKKLTGTRVAPLGRPLPPREALGDLDETAWEKRDGKPVDPWQQRVYLELTRQHDGQQLVFSTSTDGGKKAIAHLTYEAMQKPEGLFPVVMLTDGSYPNKKHGGRTQYPEFKIIKWANADGTPVSAETVRAHERRALEILDDEIPF